MNPFTPFLLLLLFSACKHKTSYDLLNSDAVSATNTALVLKQQADTASWSYFLQHLPQAKGTVLDYRGKPVANGEKAYAVLPYDVGQRDLQQCADALMRLRAEYLFSQRRHAEIHFRFTDGQTYLYSDYLKGRIPVAKGNDVVFAVSALKQNNKASLRNYLDYVYTYAGTLSLAQELTDAKHFAIGTVVLKPGSPGHCFIIVDEATTVEGEPLYKLVEGYTPAQTIYVLRNTTEPALSCWHRLKKGQPIETASYRFERYFLKRFE